MILQSVMLLSYFDELWIKLRLHHGYSNTKCYYYY